MSDKILLVFDFDGTLANTQPQLDLALKEFSDSRGLPHDAAKMARGYIDPTKFDLGWGLPLEQQKDVAHDFQDFLRDICPQEERFMSPLFDGVAEFLEQIRHDYICSVVTARDRTSFLSIFDYHQLHEIFPHYRTSCCARERGYKIKPHADAVHCLIRELPYQPEQVIVIGDTTSDIGMARNMGSKSIGVLWGAHDRHLLHESGADAIANSVAELSGLITAITQ